MRAPSSQVDHHLKLKTHFLELSKYLDGYPKSNPTSTASSKFARFTPLQFIEITTDVYDEVMRREDNRGDALPFLPYVDSLHPKRNEARQTLAVLPFSVFKSICNEVYHEVKRRYPEFAEDSSSDGTSPSPVPLTTYDLRAILQSKSSNVDDILGVEGGLVQEMVDLLQMELCAIAVDPTLNAYRKKCRKCLRILMDKHKILPTSLFMEDVVKQGDYALTGGGFSDIWKGNMGNDAVCLKVLRIHLEGDHRTKENVAREFYKEILLWTQLRHPNLLPFLGVNTTLFPSGFCFISPWMDNGSIINFLAANPKHDRLTTLLEIAAGIAYLHSLKVAHGDIKGINILVNHAGRCHLADFGLAATVATTTIFQSSTNHRGSLRWMAPELFHIGNDYGQEDDDIPSKTGPIQTGESARLAPDIYAFGCTVLEIITGKPPFPDLMDPQVMLQVVVHRKRPPQPKAASWCPNSIWRLVGECWAHEIGDRPNANEVLAFLTRLEGLRSSGRDWEEEVPNARWRYI